MATRAKRVGGDRLIKKYPNRRLYDTQTSTYVTLADIKGLVMSGEEFKVVVEALMDVGEVHARSPKTPSSSRLPA